MSDDEESGYNIIIATKKPPISSRYNPPTVTVDRTIFCLGAKGIEVRDNLDPASFLDDVTIAEGIFERMMVKKWLRTAYYHRAEEEHWKGVAHVHEDLARHYKETATKREGAWAAALFSTAASLYGYWASIWWMILIGGILSLISLGLFQKYKYRSAIHE